MEPYGQPVHRIGQNVCETEVIRVTAGWSQRSFYVIACILVAFRRHRLRFADVGSLRSDRA